MTQPASRDAPTTTRWRLVLMLIGAGVVAAFQIGKAPAAIPALRAELGLTLFASAWVISLLNVLTVLAGSAAGALADWRGHRRASLAGLWLIALASLAGGFAPGGGALLASRLVEGLGFLLVIVAAPSLILEFAAPRDRRLALSAWGCYMPLGAGTMILASPVMLLSFGWRGLWWANALIAALYAVALAAATRGTAPEAKLLPPRLWRDLRRAAGSRGALLLALAFATYAANWLAVMGFLPTYLAEQRGFGPAAVAGLTALAVFANAGGNLLGGWLLHRGAARWRLMALALVAMALSGPAIYAQDAPDGLRYLACLAFSGLSGLLPASVLAAAPRYAPSPSLIGTMNGLLVQGSNLGQLAGPPILAALVSGLGWSGSPLFVIAASALGLAAVLGLRQLEPNAAPAAAPPAPGRARHG